MVGGEETFIELALLREWEGEFRRNADGADGTDTGECSTIDFTHHVFSLLLQKCTEEQGHAHAGRIKMSVMIQVGSRCGICLLLIHLSLPLA